MSSKKALGRGLEALLQTDAGGDDMAGVKRGLESTPIYDFEDRMRLLGRVAEIDTEAIRPNPMQPRQHFDEDALDELAASIRHLGIIQPITVRALGNGRFELITGERRLRASRRAGLKHIPAYVRSADTEQMLEMALVENVQREELDPIEIAVGYQRLVEECGLTQEEVGAKVGKNRTTIANFLRLLKLPARVQASLREGELSIGHARALINVDDKTAQDRMLDEALRRQLSVREIEKLVQRWQKKQSEEQPGDSSAITVKIVRPDRDQLQISAFTDALRKRFGTQVAIKNQAASRSGKIELSFYSDEDLERLMELLLS